jgi:ThiF family protein
VDLMESLNRTVKLAMDEGRAASLEEAQALFAGFQLRIHIPTGALQSPAIEAAALTLIHAAPKTFHGGVEVTGDTGQTCSLAWFAGRPLSEIASAAGCAPSGALAPHAATICLGPSPGQVSNFCVGMAISNDGFLLTPDASSPSRGSAPLELGVAVAGAALNEAFQYLYRKHPLAGQREVRFSLPAGIPQHCESVWLIGLGHLGQAALWTLVLSQRLRYGSVLRLTDYDKISKSSLSTCLLVDKSDIGRFKVDVVAERMEQLGYKVDRDYSKLDLDSGPVHSKEGLAMVAVDNVALRRGLDRLKAGKVLEAGIGDGVRHFTQVQLHAFPGSRLARDIWSEGDAQASRPIDITMPAYQDLLRRTKDECGTTLVAGRSVATPFVGAFAGAVLAHVAVASCGADALHFDVNSL